MLRESALGLLVVAYASVSVVAYTDYPRQGPDASLTVLEQSGLAVWRQHNCQACHQIYGFGGFLGPDLTNRITDTVTDPEFGWILANGSGRMPALRLGAPEQQAVLAYLRAMNRTGRSQPRPLGAGRSIRPVENYERIEEEWARRGKGDLQPTARHGGEVWNRSQCGTCHIPFDVGPTLAPDLSGWALDRSAPTLRTLLRKGRARMPSFESLTGADIVGLSAYLEWVCQQRAALIDLNDAILERPGFSWRALPWFEYN